MINFEKLQEENSNIADRLAFVDFTLRYTGVIKRSDIGEMFNVGTAAASKVIAEYAQLRPKNIEYDPRTRLNTIIRKDFIPLINIEAETALGMLANGFNKNKLYDEPKTILPFEKIGKISNQLETECIAKISRAISGGYAIKCNYLSQSSTNRDSRTIIPLTIMYDGNNWMFRGYDRDCKSNVFFKNFHFSRCRKLEECHNIELLKKKRNEELNQDLSWTTQVPLELELHPNLDNNEKESVRTDFGMKDDMDRVIIPTRQTFIWMLTRKWSIDMRTTEEVSNDLAAHKKQHYNFRLTNLDTVNYYDSLIKESRA